MATPATSVGYSISIGNGGTCVTGWTRTSKVSKNAAARRRMSAASACARATSSSVSARPSSMFQITVALIRLRCSCEQRPVLGREALCPQGEEDLACAREVRVRRLDPAPERLESRPSRIDHRDDLGIDGHRGGAGGRPGDAQPVEVRRLRRDHRQVGPIRHHRQEQGRVLDGARHRPVHGQILRIGVGPRGHEPDRGPESDHAAEARGVAQRPAEIAAVGDRHHPAGQRRGRTARGPSRALATDRAGCGSVRTPC